GHGPALLTFPQGKDPFAGPCHADDRWGSRNGLPRGPLGPRLRVSRFARIVVALTLTIAAARTAPRASAAGPAKRTSRSRRARCRPATSCRCAATWPPSPIFCNEVKGKSMLALSRDLGTSYKTAFVLAHKLREAMATELRGRMIGGEGKVAEIDAGYFGGYVR